MYVWYKYVWYTKLHIYTLYKDKDVCEADIHRQESKVKMNKQGDDIKTKV